MKVVFEALLTEVCHLTYCYASTRLMAATIIGHGDRIGCCFPPKVAPVQAFEGFQRRLYR